MRRSYKFQYINSCVTFSVNPILYLRIPTYIYIYILNLCESPYIHLYNVTTSVKYGASEYKVVKYFCDLYKIYACNLSCLFTILNLKFQNVLYNTHNKIFSKVLEDYIYIIKY